MPEAMLARYKIQVKEMFFRFEVRMMVNSATKQERSFVANIKYDVSERDGATQTHVVKDSCSRGRNI